MVGMLRPRAASVPRQQVRSDHRAGGDCDCDLTWATLLPSSSSEVSM